jgi:phosphoribosylaminoimidazole carboxylase (NCAIR synthetase)
MNRDKKILIVGGSYLQLPAIIKAKKMGLKVAVADYNPDAIGVTYADKFTM